MDHEHWKFPLTYGGMPTEHGGPPANGGITASGRPPANDGITAGAVTPANKTEEDAGSRGVPQGWRHVAPKNYVDIPYSL